MRYLVLISLLFTSVSNATIEGPRCNEITEKQEALLEGAARKYLESKNTDQLEIVKKSIQVTHTDCHDYDGVHSSTIYLLEWTQIDSAEEMACEIEVAVAVDYKGKKKVINKKSTFEVEEASEIKCVN